MHASDTRQVRAAQNQSLFRDINERINDMNETWDMFAPVGEWVCECADLGCADLLPITLAEYEAIRAHPARFPVAPGHIVPDVETVVETTARYVVVEKIALARVVAEEADPR